MNGPAARLRVVRVEGFRQRLQGLIGHPPLPDGQAVLLPRCSAVHTAFMRYAIDVVFVDACGKVLRVVRPLHPWRMAWCPGATQVLEMRAGAAPADAVLQGVIWQALGIVPAPHSNAKASV